jgi:hypothetical protein
MQDSRRVCSSAFATYLMSVRSSVTDSEDEFSSHVSLNQVSRIGQQGGTNIELSRISVAIVWQFLVNLPCPIYEKRTDWQGNYRDDTEKGNDYLHVSPSTFAVDGGHHQVCAPRLQKSGRLDRYTRVVSKQSSLICTGIGLTE